MLVYVFLSGGKIYHDRETVRFALGWPGDKYTYFSKVEAVTRRPAGESVEVAAARCAHLLSEALTVLIEDHYPLDEDLKRSR